MAQARALRGSCHCGRNQYIVQIPSDAAESAQILFDTDPGQRISSASPISAFLRVPLSWYHSETFAFFPDETRAMIRRAYSHPAGPHSQRHFCGFCGTPISVWSEEPRTEADYISLTLGSLLTEDLHDLEELGLVPEDDDAEEDGAREDEMEIVHAEDAHGPDTQPVGRALTSIPWFESLIQGSRLGNMRKTSGVRESRDGRARVEWEITEWTADDDAEASESSNGGGTTGKRKREDRNMDDVPGRSTA